MVKCSNTFVTTVTVLDSERLIYLTHSAVSFDTCQLSSHGVDLKRIYVIELRHFKLHFFIEFNWFLNLRFNEVFLTNRAIEYIRFYT